jgi:sodium/hydrogen exchanger 8
MRISGGLFNIIGVLMQDNSDGNETGYMGQNYDEGPSTSSKFKSKLRDLRRR